MKKNHATDAEIYLKCNRYLGHQLLISLWSDELMILNVKAKENWETEKEWIETCRYLKSNGFISNSVGIHFRSRDTHFDSAVLEKVEHMLSKMAKKYPNDMDLGKQIRKIVNHIKE